MVVDPCCGGSLQTGTKVVAIVYIVIQVAATLLIVTSIQMTSERSEDNLESNTASYGLKATSEYRNSSENGNENADFNSNNQTIPNTATYWEDAFTKYGNLSTQLNREYEDAASSSNNQTNPNTTLYEEETNPKKGNSSTKLNREEEDESNLNIDYDYHDHLPPPASLVSTKERNAFSDEVNEFVQVISKLGTLLILFIGIMTNLILAIFLLKGAQQRALDPCKIWFGVETMFTIFAFGRFIFFVITFGMGVVVFASIPFHILDVYSLWVVGAFIQELAQDVDQGVVQFVGFTRFIKT